MPLGPGRNLRTMYDVGPALFTPADGDTIVFFDFFNISTTPYMLVVVTSGEIYAVNTNTGSSTSIAPDGTITNPVRTGVGLTQYGSQYVQIVAQQTNGYWIWDGTTFYVPGGPLPPGTAGTSGLTTMPVGLGGSAIENYLGRTWIANNATITFSAPGSLIDFSSADGGGNFTSTDSFLRVKFVGLKQTNGFLYLIADSSVNYISGVQTSGSPPVTTFTNQNADPEVGSPWPATIDVFNRNILFANAFGAQVSYGGSVTKISEMLDGVYNTVPNFGNITPSRRQGHHFWQEMLDPAAADHRPHQRSAGQQDVPVERQVLVGGAAERAADLYPAPGDQLGFDDLRHQWAVGLSAVRAALDGADQDRADQAVGQAGRIPVHQMGDAILGHCQVLQHAVADAEHSHRQRGGFEY